MKVKYKHMIRIRVRWLTMAVILTLMIFHHQPALALSHIDSSSPVPAAVAKLIQFCTNPKVGLDTQAVYRLVDYVLEPKPDKEVALPELQKCPGAYYELDTRISFLRLLEYTYTSKIPVTITKPSSIRYSLWSSSHGGANKPTGWRSTSPSSNPVIIHGSEHESITPDLVAGVYYEYDLKRTLIHLNYKGRQVLISISKQVNQSDVGKKGAILGNDEDWNYYYSGESGSFNAGLGWVKSYIYDFLSVGVYVESGTSPAMVRTGVFQWIRAGWSGINFVQEGHIITGMKRFARDFRKVLESPNLPIPNEMISTYKRLAALPYRDLNEKYAALQEAQKSLAMQTGKIGKAEIKGQGSPAPIPKEQIIEELMLEYLKMSLGKPTLVGKSVFSSGK